MTLKIKHGVRFDKFSLRLCQKHSARSEGFYFFFLIFLPEKVMKSGNKFYISIDKTMGKLNQAI